MQSKVLFFIPCAYPVTVMSISRQAEEEGYV